MSSPSHQERLAAAARALAAAEGRHLAVVPDADAPLPRVPAAAASPRKEPLAPPPDPQSEDGEPDPHEVARKIVLKQLAGSAKSRRQLADVLARRGCDPQVATEVLDRLQRAGLVDDEEFAATLVRSKQASRGLATRALKQELRAKGVDDETAEAVLSEVSPAQEEDRARALVAKRLRSMHGLDATVQTRRLAGMLARKGYGTEVAMRVIREAVAGAPEHQRD